MGDSVYPLYQWSVIKRGGPYTAPELCFDALQGMIGPGHPKYSEGYERRILTSRIVSVDGRVITTESGNKYRLMNISRRYREWLHENGRTYFPSQPVRFV